MGKTCLRNKEEGLSGATREASQGGQLLSAEGEHGVRGTGWSGGQAMGSGSCLACAVGKEGGVCVCACLCVCIRAHALGRGRSALGGEVRGRLVISQKPDSSLCGRYKGTLRQNPFSLVTERMGSLCTWWI